MEERYSELLRDVCSCSSIDFDRLQGKNILITGATGLIGSNIVYTLLQANQEKKLDITIYALVRDLKKAQRLFGNDKHLKYVVGDVNVGITEEFHVNFVIHAASQTSSKSFVDEPVETILTAFEGTKNILDFAKAHDVESFVYLSTMEVYGSPQTDEKIAESHYTNLDTMKVRSCYPESKRMCESLCTCYATEYSVPIKVIRLTQTFGPGVAYNDGRVFAEFARCAIEGRDIVLHTKGETKRSYLYTGDAITAILTVLTNGDIGAAYNAANEQTYCSIFEMANMVAKKCADSRIEVRIELEDENKFGFAPVLHMNLDTTKLRNLGWTAKYDLEDMYKLMIDDMKGRA